MLRSDRGPQRATVSAWVLLIATLIGACGSDDQAPSSGFVSQQVFAQQRDEFLAFATTGVPGPSILRAVLQMERMRIDPQWEPLQTELPSDGWDADLSLIPAFADGRDFVALDLLVALLEHRGHPLIRTVQDQAGQALIEFKYWYTEPTPSGIIDDSYYWSENHQIVYHASEYLAGQLYPETIFSNDGKSGNEHRDHAAALIDRWIDFRVRFGFSEWHSNVYYQKDFIAILALAEHAEDTRLATRAAMVADLILLDLALHTREGVLGATQGRSEKIRVTDGKTGASWGAAKFVFGQSPEGYQSIHPDTTLLAIADNYQIPEVIRRIGRDRATLISKESMGVQIPEDSAGSADDAPHGLAFDDPQDLPFWWGMGALTSSPIVPLTIETLNQYNLWETELFQPFRGLRPLTTDPILAQQLAAAISPQLNERVLQKANTYTYRTADYMLSTAQDYRKGRRALQVHAWHATLGVAANVFTTHPASPPIETTAWNRDHRPGYWTGNGSLPRSAQHENVAVHIYSPGYAASAPPPLDLFRWEPYTHAYFPQDAFDEVVSRSHWTFGRKGNGYIALYSHRAVEWVDYDPEQFATNGQQLPFDLRANGGADNVWIVECGSADQWGDFTAFVDAISSSQIQIEGSGEETSVDYTSPSQGPLHFGWQGPLEVDGSSQALTYNRLDNPYVTTSSDGTVIDVTHDGWELHLDFNETVRTVRAPSN